MKQNLIDLTGICATSICALHCLLLPVMLPVLPLLGLHWISDPRFETVLLLLSVAIAILALAHGYFRHHRRSYPLLIAALGLLVYINRASLGESHEAGLLSLGAAFIVWAHIANLRLRSLPAGSRG